MGPSNDFTEIGESTAASTESPCSWKATVAKRRNRPQIVVGVATIIIIIIIIIYR